MRVVEAVTFVAMTVIPVPLIFTVVAPVMKFVPVSVSVTVLPCAPDAWLRMVSVGAGGPPLNVTDCGLPAALSVTCNVVDSPAPVDGV